MNISEQNKFVGEKIKNFRKDKRYSQKELGDKIGVKDNTISAYERGVIEIPSSKLHEIARALDVSYTKFLPLETTTVDDTLKKAMYIVDQQLEADETEFLSKLIEKTLSLSEKDRKRFMENINFAIEYFDKK